MSSCQSTGATSTTLAPVRSEDPVWAHARVVPGARNNIECLYCNKVIRGGGITRLKYHLAGISGNLEACKKELLDEIKRSKEKKRKISSEIGGDIDLTYDDIDDRTTPRAQLSIKSSMYSNEMFVQAKMAVARWWYDSNLPFNAAQSKFYQPAIDAMTAIGSGFKGLSLYELRGNLLKMTVNEVQDYLQQIKKVWNDTGCTLMTDGWTNQKQQSIINFLFYCPKGTMFLKSIDTFGLKKDSETLFNIFDEVVQEIGAENLVQFIMDNDASYKSVGKKQKKITKFIYNHGWVLALMRQEFTKDHDLCRLAITTFATNFLSIQCLLLFKKKLRQMFMCDKWIASSHSKSIIGKEIAEIVLEDKEFWLNLAMVYLHDAMERTKENINTICNNKVSIFSPFIRIIDFRWDKQLHSPLHAASCLLNPGIFYRPSFNSCIMKMELDPNDQDKIIAELDLYNNAVGEFGHSLAIRQRDKLNRVAWWTQFGCEVPTLQKFAVRVLSQCCSATGCERNWSIFDFIHSKKRNRLVHKRLNDLVFVRYNLKLRERSIKKGRDALNPINLENIDLMEEWVSEEFELLDEEDLDWASIEEPLISLIEEDIDNVGVDVDDGGDIDDNILINMSNLDPYCLFDEDE
ncbi:hypothetical protein CIPAW_09G222200 [Carya illinoinensis]|uniref:BED-type domain-containing protein n=1 Tax=Carya illinoinensis TaxID=32201 RepID=A0A8T1PL20_CARIL|nr:hypothetical protein CIPAW_09G222200 [Carya illinoinensis]